MVEFADRDELEKWLKTQPKEVSVMIAARSALRVAPLLNVFPEIKDRQTTDIILSTFRALALPWVAAHYPAYGSALVRYTVSAASASHVSSSQTLASPYASYASSAISTATSASITVASADDIVVATSAADTFIDLLFSALSVTFSDASAAATATAVDLDTDQVVQGKTAAEISQLPLWSQGQPGDVEDYWRALKEKLLSLDNDWQVWTDWYETRLNGHPVPNEKLELARATIEDEIWERGPAVVNAHIKKLIKKHTPKPKTELGQRLAPYQFYAKDGKIYAKPLEGDPSFPEMAEDLRQGLQDKVHVLMERLTGLQVPSDVQEDLSDLLTVLGEHIEDVKPGQLLDASDSIDADMAAYDSAEGREQFSPEALAKIKKVLLALSRLKSSFPEIVQLEAAALAQNMTGPMAEKFMEQTSKPILKGARQNTDVISEEAFEGLEAGIPLINKLIYKAHFAIDDLTREQAWKELGLQVARHSGNLRNCVAALLVEIKASRPAMETGKTVKAYTKDFPENAGKATIAAGISGGTMAFTHAAACAAAGSLVFSIAVPIAGAAALGLTMWAQLDDEAKDLKDPQSGDNKNGDGEKNRET